MHISDYYTKSYRCPNCGDEMVGEFGLVICNECNWILDDRDIIEEQDLATTFTERHIGLST